MVTENNLDLPNIDDLTSDKMSPNVPAETTAIIRIKPDTDLAVVSLKDSITKLKEYALARTITKDEDVSPITDDLAVIAGLKKSLNALKDQYVKPVKAHLADIVTVFTDLGILLDEADRINRTKVTAYRVEQQKRAAEAAEINRQKEELARKEAAFNGTGEVTIDTTPVEAAPVLHKVSTDMGSLGTQTVWKWSLEDLSKVPVEYLTIDAVKVGKVVRAGLRNIPGIRIFSEDVLRVNTR